MQRLTQTRSDNCWPTCVAMLLGCSVESLPENVFVTRAQYVQALRVYLCKHHGMTYLEDVPEKAVTVVRGFHLMIGESVRTTAENDTWHAIVGLNGEPYWDVNPSRAGLTKVCGWGVLIAVSEKWRTEWRNREEAGEKDMKCLCVACRSAPIEIGERKCSEARV